MKYTMLRCAFVAALAGGLSAPAQAGELKLTMQNGRVTIIADNVPLRQILQEWARVGQTKIVNAEKMNGPAITLQLVNAPERDALDVLLRSASGYIAAPRPVPIANAAFYDRVTIMPTSHAPAVTATNSPQPQPFQRPPMPMDDSDEPINVVMPPGTGNPNMAQFPGMAQQPGGTQMMQPGQPPQATPNSPLSLPRPGAVPPQPQQMPVGPNPYLPNPNPNIRPGNYPPGLIPQGARGGGPGGPG